jgi:hypothetical protein
MSWIPFRNAATRALWRELIMEEQHGRCARCERAFAHPESVGPAAYLRLQPRFYHIVPPSRGGSDAFDNLRLIHRWCETPARRRANNVSANAQGERWCRSRRWKRVYTSLPAVWLGVLRTFLQTSGITTPYYCGRGCGFWHLTSRASHVLARFAAPALSGVGGLAAYHYAADGSWVRKDGRLHWRSAFRASVRDAAERARMYGAVSLCLYPPLSRTQQPSCNAAVARSLWYQRPRARRTRQSPRDRGRAAAAPGGLRTCACQRFQFINDVSLAVQRVPADER